MASSTTKPSERLTHVHFWRIAPADGRPTSTGTCDCGETREFRNAFDDDSYFEMYNKRHSKYAEPEEKTNVWWW